MSTRMHELRLAASVLAVLSSVASGCRPEPEPTPRPIPTNARSDAKTIAPPADPEAAPSGLELPEIPTRFAKARRVVAIGDLHGDLAATRKALQLAGAIAEGDTWTGGDLVLVQTGDQLDRGDDEPEILDLLDRLTDEAAKAGGAMHVLNGNHEFMNALGDLRYVTPEGMEDFAGARPRAAAFAPGAPYARRLARRNTIVIVGDTVFVHGGVLPTYAGRIDAINSEARRWLWGLDGVEPPIVGTIMAEDSPVWTRAYGEPMPSEQACAALDEALRTMNAARMVVGHTVQKGGITSACDEKVWRIDVGMSSHYGGTPQALEITDAGVKILG
jgi:hypothetical protein